MNLDRAERRAESVRGRKAAARLHADIEFELAMGEPTWSQARDGEHALELLEHRYPGIRQDATDVVENGHLPLLSRRAKQRLDGEGPIRPRVRRQDCTERRQQPTRKRHRPRHRRLAMKTVRRLIRIVPRAVKFDFVVLLSCCALIVLLSWILRLS